MKYIQVKFTAEPDSQDVRDIIAALTGEIGFDSFTDEPDGLVGYCQEDLSTKIHSLRPYITCLYQT